MQFKKPSDVIIDIYKDIDVEPNWVIEFRTLPGRKSEWVFLEGIEDRADEIDNIVKKKNIRGKENIYISMAIHDFEKVKAKLEEKRKTNRNATLEDVQGEANGKTPTISDYTVALVIDIDNEKLHKTKVIEDVNKAYKEAVESWKHLKEKLAELDIIPRYVFFTGGGYQLWLVAPEPEPIELIPVAKKIIPEALKQLLPEGWKVDDIFDKARIVRVPLSWNWNYKDKSGKPIRVAGKLIEFNDVRTPLREVLDKLAKLVGGSEEKKAVTMPAPQEQKLKDEHILKIVELLRPAYKPGQRDLIVFYLSGWLRKANVDYESARKVIEVLAQGDEEFKHRIYVLDRTYGKRGNPPSAKEMAGKSGLQEVLEETLGEGEALTVIKEIEEILNTASPHADSIFAIINYAKQMYYVANFRRHAILRGRFKEQDGKRTFIYMERIVKGVPTKVVRYINPLGGITRYDVVWEVPDRPRPIVLEGVTTKDIVSRLRAEGLVFHTRLVEDAVNAIIEAMVEKGKVETREEIDKQGFFIIDGELRGVKVEVPDKVDLDELREALDLLDELATEWYADVQDKFATVIKWFAVAPFIYAQKQEGRWVPWLYLFGASMAGKSTMAEIGANIWNRHTKIRELTGSNIDTVARLGKVLESGTFPIIINEPGAVFTKEDLADTIKNSITSLVARGRFMHGEYVEVPALTPLCFTSNRVLVRDDALLRRFVVLNFHIQERRSEEAIQKFKEVKTKFPKLGVIGDVIAYAMLKTQKKFDDTNWQDVAEWLLKKVYEVAGREAPEWIAKRAETETQEDLEEIDIENLREFLISKINDAYQRYVGKIEIITENSSRTLKNAYAVPVEWRAEVVAKNNLISWLMWKSNSILITAGILNEVRDFLGDITMRSLAELLGGEYTTKKIGGKARKVIIIKFEKFAEFLTPTPEF